VPPAGSDRPEAAAADLADPLPLLERLRATPELLAAVAASTAAALEHQKRLRECHDSQLVRAAIALHQARQRAVGRFPAAERLWLTGTGLEQATLWQVAQHKACRFAGCHPVADLCCGIGSDTAALSLQTEVLAIDQLASMVRRAGWNTEILGRPDCFAGDKADVTARDWSGWWVHADPDRRAGRPRPTRRLAEYRPGLDWMLRLLATARGGGIKLGPASDWPQQCGTLPGCEVELTTAAGECREATLWFGDLAGSLPRRATNLDTGETLAGRPGGDRRRVAGRLGRFIAEPDPAVVRAGLVDLLAAEHGLARVDSREDYLTGDTRPATGLLSLFAVEAVMPTGIKRLRQSLRPQPRRSYEIKCRRLSIAVETVRRQLPRGDGPPAVVIFCLSNGQRRAVLGRRLSAAGDANS